jgi:hypothetical protein
MTENSKQFNLEERIYQFVKNVSLFVGKLPRSTSNIENGKQEQIISRRMSL